MAHVDRLTADRRHQLLAILTFILALAFAPQALAGGGGTPKVVAGTDHTCALTDRGTVWCWGANTFGQLGTGDTISSQVPVAVQGVSGITNLALGAFHTCAIVAGGSAKCWGYNNKGQLGDGSAVNSSSPVSVVGLAGITHLSAAFTHTCAVTAGTQVTCWGDNAKGQLGNSTAGAGSNTPVSVDEAVVSGSEVLPSPVAGATPAATSSPGRSRGPLWARGRSC